jgi:hypothetical protein
MESLAVYEVDYSVKDMDKFKADPHVPTTVVAENITEAVKRAKEFENDNISLLKCNLVGSPTRVAIQKKVKGLEPKKETA